MIFRRDDYVDDHHEARDGVADRLERLMNSDPVVFRAIFEHEYVNLG